MRLIIAADAALVRQGVARLLEDNGFEILAQLPDATDLLQLVGTHRPDVVIVDARMAPTHATEGLEAALDIKRQHPPTGVLVLSQHLESRLAMKLLGDGRRGVGYLLKERVSDLSEFTDAVRRGGTGGTAVDPDIARLLLDRARRGNPLDELSPREREVLGLIAEADRTRRSSEVSASTPRPSSPTFAASHHAGPPPRTR